MHCRNEQRLAGLKVLVLEDEALVAMEFELLLMEQGCAVLGPAATVASALDLICHDRPDAALIDVNLPDGQSTAVAVRLRKQGVPFVVVSGYDLQQLGEPELLNAASVSKPADHDEVIRALACVLSR